MHLYTTIKLHSDFTNLLFTNNYLFIYHYQVPSSKRFNDYIKGADQTYGVFEENVSIKASLLE